MVATPESPARTYGCPWCGGNPERKSAKGPPPLFCSPKCRTAMEGLKLADGRAIIAFAKAWRISRNNPRDSALGAACLTEMSSILDQLNERDRKAGRTSAMTLSYAERLLKAPDKYRDRSDNVRWKRERAARENAANPQKAVAAAASPD